MPTATVFKLPVGLRHLVDRGSGDKTFISDFGRAHMPGGRPQQWWHARIDAGMAPVLKSAPAVCPDGALAGSSAMQLDPCSYAEVTVAAPAGRIARVGELPIEQPTTIGLVLKCGIDGAIGPQMPCNLRVHAREAVE